MQPLLVYVARAYSQATAIMAPMVAEYFLHSALAASDWSASVAA